MGRNDEAWAVFWCSLLSPVLLDEIPAGQREAYFRKVSQVEHLLPSGQRQRVSARTVRRWWDRLRKGGVPNLYRKPRNDRGQPRRAQANLLARATQLKREQPYRSDEVLNRILRKEFGREVPRSTLYRHLRREGVTKRLLGISQEKVRCRWTREQSNALWVGDFEQGPLVIHGGQAVKTHLSAWIDCHSRYIVEARYYVRENLDILIDSLLRAWTEHGASRELYVDNAKIYHANALVLACAQLNIKLLHRPPRDPAAGGLIERFFETTQSQFEAEVRATKILTLDDLNHVFQAWLNTAYHSRRHSETGQSARERYQEAHRFQRAVNLQAVLEFFLQQEQRTVNPDFSDVRIDNATYAVDPRWRDEKVLVKYDPFLAPIPEVQLYSLQGQYLGVGRRYEREKGAHPPPPSPAPRGPIQAHYLDVLRSDQAAQHRRQRQAGIDFHSARQRNRWSGTAFAQQFARLLAKPGGLSGFTPAELQVLADFHARHERLNESLLRQAIAHAEAPTIPCVLWQLQHLLQPRND